MKKKQIFTAAVAFTLAIGSAYASNQLIQDAWTDTNLDPTCKIQDSPENCQIQTTGVDCTIALGGGEIQTFYDPNQAECLVPLRRDVP